MIAATDIPGTAADGSPPGVDQHGFAAAAPNQDPGLRSESRRGDTQDSGPISSRDREIMAAIKGPKEAAAALDPFELADWLERPEIRRALDAREEVRDIRLRDKIAAATERAVDQMTAVLDANTDLKDPAQRVETRRASSSILRLSASFNRSGYSGLRATLRSSLPPTTRLRQSPIAHGPLPSHDPWEYSPDCACEHCDAARVAAQRRATDNAALQAPPSSTQPPRVVGVNHPPPSPPPREPELLPGSRHLVPEDAVAAFLTNVRRLDARSIDEAMLKLQYNLTMSIRMYGGDWRRFAEEFAGSVVFTARGPWRAEPARVEGDAACQRVIFSLDDGREAACLIHLVKAQKHYPATHWFVDGITPDDSS